MAGPSGDEIIRTLRNSEEFKDALAVYQTTVALILPDVRQLAVADSPPSEEPRTGLGGSWYFIDYFSHVKNMWVLDGLMVEAGRLLAAWADRYDPDQVEVEQMMESWEQTFRNESDVYQAMLDSGDLWERKFQASGISVPPSTEIDMLDGEVGLLFLYHMVITRRKKTVEIMRPVVESLATLHAHLMEEHIRNEDPLQQAFNLLTVISRMVAKGESIRNGSDSKFFSAVDVLVESFAEVAPE